MTKNTDTVVQELTDYLNSFTSKEKEFCESMSRGHRTLQQGFTRLCLQWLEHCATDDYHTDGRNKSSQEVAKKIMSMWEKDMMNQGYNGSTLEVVNKPSKWLRFI